jgi:hypothetical protein
MDEQEIKIVRVTTSDYNKVMDICPPSEIYEGTDYLPDYFRQEIIPKEENNNVLDGFILKS